MRDNETCNQYNGYINNIFLVGADVRLIPIMENIIPDIPTVGMEEDTMKDANTDIRYIGRRILGDVFFFKQNHSA